jgi:hypothetical protein
LALDLELDEAQFTILIPLPGTELYGMAQRTNAFRCDPKDFERFYWYFNVSGNMTRLPDERLIELQKQAYERWNTSRKWKTALS